MGRLDLDKRYDRRGTDSVKWDHKNFVDSRVSENALPLWLSDMEFKVADEIIEALTNRVKHGFFGHSMPGDKYFEAVQGWYKRRFNWDIDKGSIFYSPGVLPALGFIIRAFTKMGEGVIIQPPVFYPFAELIEGTDRVVVNNVLINNEGDYSIDFKDLESKAKDPNNTMLILCSPHNPVGRVWTKEEITKIVDICRENDVLIFSDEIDNYSVSYYKPEYLQFTGNYAISNYGDTLSIILWLPNIFEKDTSYGLKIYDNNEKHGYMFYVDKDLNYLPDNILDDFDGEKAKKLLIVNNDELFRMLNVLEAEVQEYNANETFH